MVKYWISFVLCLFSITLFSQNELIEVEGVIKIANSSNLVPQNGMIRYNTQTNDFEGYNGQWVSLNANSINSSNIVRDIDGNVYTTVTIFGTTWMRENLRTTRYRNGVNIPEAASELDWSTDSLGAWCWYDNDQNYNQPYGKLYNWFAVNDTNGICPTGWRVADNDDFNGLFITLITDVGGKLKEKGLAHWNAPNDGATNDTGFSAIGAGARDFLGLFQSQGSFGVFWSRDETVADPQQAFAAELSASDTDLDLGPLNKKYGLSIRCVKE